MRKAAHYSRSTRSSPQVTLAAGEALLRASRLIYVVEIARRCRLISLAICLLLAACAAAGVQVKPSQLSHFKKGVTTSEEVVATLGNPTTSNMMADGSQLLFYNYAAYQARPESFIPLVGAFVGGADVQSSMVWFQFGPDDRLTNYSASNSAIGAASNFAAPATPRTPAQPSQSPQ